MLKLKQLSSVIKPTNVRFLQTTQNLLIDHEWRRKNRLPVNPNTESPLTYLPDFTYMDGRPTPIGQNQQKRIEQQREYAKKIVQGISEIDFALKRHERIQKEKVQARQDTIDSKLKPKGFHLLDEKQK